MNNKCFSLGTLWPMVVEFFNHRYILNSSPPDLSFTLEDVVIAWVAYRILERTNSLDIDASDIPLPLYIEHDFYHDSDELIISNPILLRFEEYLDTLCLEESGFGAYIKLNIDVKNAIMFILG